MAIYLQQIICQRSTVSSIQLYPTVSSCICICIYLYPAVSTVSRCIPWHRTASKTGYGKKYTPGEGSSPLKKKLLVRFPAFNIVLPLPPPTCDVRLDMHGHAVAMRVRVLVGVLVVSMATAWKAGGDMQHWAPRPIRPVDASL